MKKSKRAIVICAKNPVLGTCKTRLAATIGEDSALAVYIEFMKYYAQMVSEVEADVYIYFANGFPNLAGEVGLIWEKYIWRKQVEGDLGKRMFTAMKDLLNEDYEKVVLLGTDCPQMKALDIEKAYDELNDVDVVWGPSEDGGYYLVAFGGEAESKKVLFENIEWSTESVLEKSLAACERWGLSYDSLKVRNDVDYYDDLVDTVEKTGMFGGWLVEQG